VNAVPGYERLVTSPAFVYPNVVVTSGSPDTRNFIRSVSGRSERSYV
jgi:hypothetical protein